MIRKVLVPLVLLLVVALSIGIAWALPAPNGNVSLLQRAVRLYLPLLRMSSGGLPAVTPTASPTPTSTPTPTPTPTPSPTPTTVPYPGPGQ